MQTTIGTDPIEHGFVGLGWPLVGDLNEIEGNREAYKAAVKDAYPDMKAGAVPVGAGTLYRFQCEIEKGDFIVYPSKHDRRVNIGKFTGKSFFTPAKSDEDIENYPHRRSVKWLKSFSRGEFSQSALYEIGAFISFFTVKRHAEEFAAKVDSSTALSSTDNAEEMLDDDSITSTVSKQAEETLHDYVIKRIYSGMSGYEFEHFTAHILECMGYTARVSKKWGDGGVDVIAHTDELGFEPPIIKVQCKRKTDQTGEPAGELHE